jgi:hypothetical protein
MDQVYYFVISYAAVAFIIFFVINWLSAGFLLNFIRVKASRGRLSLVRVRTITGDYFRPGAISDGFLVYTNREKAKKRLGVRDRSFIASAMGVKVVDVDDVSNVVLTPDGRSESGYDAIKYENLYVRTLMAPKLEDKFIKIILICVIIGVLVTVVVGVLVYKQGSKIDAMYAYLQFMANATATIG